MRKIEQETDYTITKWHGHDNYECAYCQFSSLYKFKLDEHFQYEEAHQHKWAGVDKKPFQVVQEDVIAQTELKF